MKPSLPRFRNTIPRKEHDHMSLHRHIRPTLLTLGVLAAALVSPSLAGAGQLTEILCADPATGKGVGAIAPELSNPHSAGGLDRMEYESDCTGAITSTAGIVLRPNPTVHYDDNEWGEIAYVAPPDLTLSGAQLWRAFTPPEAGSYFTTFQKSSSGPALSLPWKERYDWRLGPVGGAGNPDAPFSSDNLLAPAAANDQWYVHMKCDSPDTTGCESTTGSEYRIFAGRIRLADDGDPEMVGPMIGDLVDQSVLRGDESISFSATDVGSGVYRGIVTLDGVDVGAEVVDPNDGHCADVNPANSDPYEFDLGRPCKLTAGGTLSFDTRSWPEGAHNLKIAVEDAAGNKTGPINRSVTIDNVPPPTTTMQPAVKGIAGEGQLLVTDLGTWVGDSIQLATRWQRSNETGWSDIPGATDTTYVAGPADAGRRLRSCVVATNGEGSTEACSVPSEAVAASLKGTTSSDSVASHPPVLAVPNPAPAALFPTAHPVNGEGGGDGVRVVAVFGREEQRATRVAYGQSTMISGRLTGPSGRPVRGAIVDVKAAPRLPGAAMASVGQVRTDDDGNFHYAAPAGPSRILRFSYRAHLDDVDVGQTTDVALLVRAGVKLRLDHRTLRNRQLLKYLGQLRGPHTTGKIVDVQVRNGRRWQLVCSVKSRSGGRFSCSHRFTRTFYPTTYTFRARARSQAGFPYETGASRSVRVTVRP